MPSTMIKCCFVREWDTEEEGEGEEEGKVVFSSSSFLSSLVAQVLQNSSGLSVAPLTDLRSFSECSASGTAVYTFVQKVIKLRNYHRPLIRPTC